MSNPLIQVQGLATGGQVLTGEITPPSVGVNDYTARVVPGAEATPAGSTPVTVTEIVTGASVPRKYGAAADWVIGQEGARYGLKAQRNSGYSHKTLLPATAKTVFAVVKHNGTTGNADMLNFGGISLIKFGNQWRFIGSGTLAGATFSTAANQVQVLTLAVRGSKTLVIGADGTPHTANAVPTPSQVFELGTFSGYQESAAGCMIFDALMYERELTDTEILTVRQALQAAWNAAPVGGITWAS
ncbi:hypothetical protein [Rothia nasimurium]|uniref:hypothetical protein n=1 Tax=Rothia nasimurium TaxID=85336 RepID=UPI001F3305C4|nr:hypothetical protein [Rothia nasimurium]